MGNSWTYGDAAALARVLDAILLGKNMREAQEALRHPLAARAMRRVFRMRERGSAIASGGKLPPPATPKDRVDMAKLEPAFLPGPSSAE